ncbi:MAG TPA: hypothetical protein VGD62_09015 [Acidobacteriaceae bacterium]
MHRMHDPLWFLVLSLFLPRVALFLGWFEGWYLGAPDLVAGVLWLLLPRLLVLIIVYSLQGVGLWFLVHLLAALVTWTGSTGFYHRRRTRRQELPAEY